jgi:hypothetical protein
MPVQKVKSQTRIEQKVIRADKHNLPWTNSDKVYVVTLTVPSCEIRSGMQRESESNIAYVYSIFTLPYVLGMINSSPQAFSLDTGSTLNLCRSEEFPTEKVIPVTGVELTSASGHKIPSKGKIKLNVRLGKIEIPCEFMLVDGLEMKLLLGNDIFTNYKINIDYKNMQCEFFYNGQSSGPIPLLMQESDLIDTNQPSK